MNLAGLGSILGGAAALGSATGLFGSDDSGGNVRTEPFTRYSWQKSYELANRAYGNQIYDRVQDARRAGVHPLFALGASSSGSPPGAVALTGGGGEDAGFDWGAFGAGTEGVARGVDSFVREHQRRRTRAQTAVSEAEAMIAASRAARELQRTISVPSEVTLAQPGDPSTSAGEHTLFQEVVYGHDAWGRPKTVKVVRSDEPSESFENLGSIFMTILKNAGMLDDLNPAVPVNPGAGRPRLAPGFKWSDR